MKAPVKALMKMMGNFNVDDFREPLLEWLDLDSSHRVTSINNRSRVELGLGPGL